MSQCTDAEVKRMLPLVSEQRRQQALKFKYLFGQFACLKSYLMLCDALGKSSKEIEFLYNEHDKPYLTDGPFFNISHCKKGIAVVVDNQPVGVDIESIRNAEDALIRKTMNEDEQRQIFSSGNVMEMFTYFWTRKEALLKMQGTGIIDDLHNVLSNDDNIQTVINREKGYVLSIARKQTLI